MFATLLLGGAIESAKGVARLVVWSDGVGRIVSAHLEMGGIGYVTQSYLMAAIATRGKCFRSDS